MLTSFRYCGLLIAFLASCSLGSAPVSADDRPNILWILVDDMSANFSCYGEQTIQTPAVDRLAEQGVKFERAYATSPVCSTFRSALITGMYQTSTGVHNHRSGRGEHRIQLPEPVRPVPELFQEAGYWTCNGSGLEGYDYKGLKTPNPRPGKTDYNFDWNREMYDSDDWAGRAEGPAVLHAGPAARGEATRSFRGVV